MGEPVEEFWSPTQQQLQPLIETPILTDKLLKKPPLRFLHDIFTNLHARHQFGAGLFDEKESDYSSGYFLEKANKIAWLDKLVALTSFCIDKKLKVKSSRVTSGHEPEKTNAWLQAMAEVVRIGDKEKWGRGVEGVLSGAIAVADSPSGKKSKKERTHSPGKGADAVPAPPTITTNGEAVAEGKPEKKKRKKKEKSRSRSRSRSRDRKHAAAEEGGGEGVPVAPSGHLGGMEVAMEGDHLAPTAPETTNPPDPPKKKKKKKKHHPVEPPPPTEGEAAAGEAPQSQSSPPPPPPGTEAPSQSSDSPTTEKKKRRAPPVPVVAIPKNEPDLGSSCGGPGSLSTPRQPGLAGIEGTPSEWGELSKAFGALFGPIQSIRSDPTHATLAPPAQSTRLQERVAKMEKEVRGFVSVSNVFQMNLECIGGDEDLARAIEEEREKIANITELIDSHSALLEKAKDLLPKPDEQGNLTKPNAPE